MTLLEQLPASASVYGALRKLGGSERTVGYYYAAYGIQLALEQPQRMVLITKWLQPDIAKKYETTSAAVERGIRLLIHHMWEAQTPAWQELFPDGKRPTVSELFPIMVNFIQTTQWARSGSDWRKSVNSIYPTVWSHLRIQNLLVS